MLRWRWKGNKGNPKLAWAGNWNKWSSKFISEYNIFWKGNEQSKRNSLIAFIKTSLSDSLCRRFIWKIINHIWNSLIEKRLWEYFVKMNFLCTLIWENRKCFEKSWFNWKILRWRSSSFRILGNKWFHCELSWYLWPWIKVKRGRNILKIHQWTRLRTRR